MPSRRLSVSAVWPRGPAVAAVVAMALLVLLAAMGWPATFAAPGPRLVAASVLVALPGVLGLNGVAARAVGGTAVAIVPLAMLAGGVPVGALGPNAWSELPARLGDGVVSLLTSGAHPGAWALAAVLLLSAMLWTTGGIVSAASAGTSTRRLAGFSLLAAPWLVVVGLGAPDHAAWHGALALIAGVLWFSPSRTALMVGLPAAVASVVVAQATAPHVPWFGLGYHSPTDPPFRTLDPYPTYGPLADRRTGAPMLEISAPQPALWHMQTLASYSNGGWSVEGGGRSLPEPAARPELLRVHVLGLSDALLASPGHIDQVRARGSITRIDGDGVMLDPTPATGETYQVVASYVRTTAAQLAHDHARLDPSARLFTRLQPDVESSSALRALSWLLAPFGLSAASDPPVDPRVVALARRLAAGAHSQWETVNRVEQYLLGGGRFRYTTRVPPRGRQPLVDFLLRDHAGYCQQFAGAAALLLRLARVPARVVSGFATGVQTAPGRFTVRDLDAHEWIEVYFEGYGWVPFNPTPTTSPAAIAAGIDPAIRSPRPVHAQRSVPAALAAIPAALAVVALLGMLVRRRRPRVDPSERLARIARRVGSAVGPSTTLRELAITLSRVGPRTAALALDLERELFAADPAIPSAHHRLRLTRALVSDLGPFRAVLLYSPLYVRGPVARPSVWSGRLAGRPRKLEKTTK
jgi:hypothetical protein